MGCSQSSNNQVVPCNIYDDNSIEKHALSVSKNIFASFDSMDNDDVESGGGGGHSKANGGGGGLIGKSLVAEKQKSQMPNNNFKRQSSLDSNFSLNGSLPGDSHDYSKMVNLEEYSIDTSRAKSNFNVVTFNAKKLGIKEFPDGRHDGKPSSVYWHSIVYSDMKAIVKSPESKINKFPGMTELAKKIALTQSILSMQQLFPSEYHFYPKSWVLPAQLKDFQEYCSNLKRDSWFIVKPDDGAQGTGIYLIQTANQLTDVNSKQLIQEYIDDPFLMSDQLKFDFRVYAVIKSINPLSIYIAREGMARFCTEKYSKPTSSNFENLYSHLTNYSLNKENASYVHSTNLKDQLKGSKRLLSTVFHQMESHGVRTRRLWHGIKMIVVKTVLAMVPEIMLNYEHYFNDVPGPQCFQIMGFDIIVKKDGTPILLEVNSAPSLSIDHNVYSEDASPPVRSIVDEMIKVPLVRDTLLLVLNQLENEYNNIDTTKWDTKSMGSMASGCEDDLAMIKRKKRPHLSEIFPGRYGAVSKHLLFLDKAVYLFMQFSSIRLGMTINLAAIKSFVKKCSLSKTITNEELETKYADINYYFTGKENDTFTGLNFHGFLNLLFHISKVKFGFCDDLLASMQRFLAYCDAALRHYGVRSGRLRRTEVEIDENQNQTEIYLLPNRMRYHKNSATSMPNVGNGKNNRSRSRFTDISINSGKKQILNNSSTQIQLRAKSLPRRPPPPPQGNGIIPIVTNGNINSSVLPINNNINLPKIGLVH